MLNITQELADQIRAYAGNKDNVQSTWKHKKHDFTGVLVVFQHELFLVTQHGTIRPMDPFTIHKRWELVQTINV